MAKPYPRGHFYTMISAIGLDKVRACLYGKWSANGEIFSTFIKKSLLPHLNEGDIVIMNNVSFHKVKSIRSLVESVGAELIYLPPYSPDLSPIENMWSKIKSIIKKYAPRTESEFKKTMTKAFKSITSKDLSGWFKHCGYRVNKGSTI